MTKEEWLNIGYQNNVIDTIDISDLISFSSVYHNWFMYKLTSGKAQSVDRIECTYRRYFINYDVSIQEIDEIVISDFVNKKLLEYKVYLKELYRILQIFKEVINYSIDYGIKGTHEINWDKVKRHINYNNLYKNTSVQYCIPDIDKQKLYS